ncbi:MAG: putative membrane-anchored protein [Saprospiraceae bacterium]|jgi:uncharacterized membrane-anchored protein
MNYKKTLFPAFIILALAQLYVPAGMILKQENVLKTGKAFKFKTAPFDPYDPFRGKYIWLSFEANTVEVPVESEWEYDAFVYVTLTTDKEGFAKIASVSEEKPTDSPDFVQAKSWGKSTADSLLTVNYLFDRFYMEESKAVEAEQTYVEAQRDSSMIAYALVKVKNGNAVIENVFIDDVPIKKVVEKGRE